MLTIHHILYLALAGLSYALFELFVRPRFNPLRKLAGPPVRGLFGNHLRAVLESVILTLVLSAIHTTQPSRISSSL